MHPFAGEQIYQNLRDAGCRKKPTRVIMLLSTCKQRLVISLQTRSVARILLLGHVLIPVPGTICFLYRNAYPILNLEPLPLPVPEFGPVSVAVCAAQRETELEAEYVQLIAPLPSDMQQRRSKSIRLCRGTKGMTCNW